MNVADKLRFYSEALRVLRPGGVFYTSHYGAGPRGKPDYPLPWAAGPATSFLCSPEEAREQFSPPASRSWCSATRPRKSCRISGRTAGAWRPTGCRRWGCRRSWASGSGTLQINVARSAEGGRLTVIEALLRRPA